MGTCVEGMVGSARENTEMRNRRQGEKNTCLHGLCYRRVFRGSEVVDCAVGMEMSLSTWKKGSRRALKKKVKELERQEQKDREELLSRNERLESKLKVAKETITRLERTVRGYETSQSTKHGREERVSSGGSGISSSLNGVQR